MKYIYADLVNGCIEIQKEDAELPIIYCDDTDEARSNLDDLSEDDFEIVIEVDNETFETIKTEYGIN